MPDRTKGTTPVAFVRLGADAADDVVSTITAAVPEQLGRYVQLTGVYVADALPRTRTGKAIRRLLRDVAQNGRPSGDTSAAEDLAVLDSIVDMVSRKRDEEEA